jgi:uncharacterized protein GlcG (DUF336 family)
MKTALKLQIDEARLMARAALLKAQEIAVLETVCITDEGGFPLVMERMDGARVTGPQIAWNKAFTAAGHKRSTHLFNTAPNGPALPGNEAFGIQWSFEGKFAVFVAGSPSWSTARSWAAWASAVATASRTPPAVWPPCKP